MKSPTIIVTGRDFKPIMQVYTFNGKPTHKLPDLEIYKIQFKMIKTIINR